MHKHSVQFEPHDNGKEVRARCTKCHANAMFFTEPQTPTPVKNEDGEWELQHPPLVVKTDKGEWTAAAAEDVEKWLGTECPVSDDDAAEALAADLTNPKPPIVLKG